MRPRRLLLINLGLVLLYLTGLQIWFRVQGDTQRTAAVAILVLGLMSAALHVLVLIALAIYHRIRGDLGQAGAFVHATLLVILGALFLSFVNGVVLQLQ